MGFMMFSSFLGSMTSSMTRIRMAAITRTQQEEAVRKYLKQNHISMELGNRITSCIKANQHVRRQVKLPESKVTAFVDLPESLRRQLRCEVYVPHITLHPFFFHLTNDFPNMTSDVCFLALTEASVERGGELFSYQAEASAMYVVVSGTFKYFEGLSEVGSERALMKSEWMCEAALWVQCQHWGRVCGCASVCDAMRLDSKAFHTAARRNPETMRTCQKYASLFAAWVGEQRRSTSLPWDILSDFDSIQEVAQRAFC
eukprot:gnl/TRDRNA2_/TRDRNA2_76621_c0_seq1.p1 gnl/TRDRNA2_/TRDRNA2_76621_c0~~gnl/TRDRNA2_/TRDRNA2_76621_c0_seq1.p1  ORF type:complete len:257 (-),score=30.97 gnl/TRDRNA2_/TRDRNA2_76621_c0_seq1:299-1069(-)